MRQKPQCAEQVLYKIITAFLIVYHRDVFQHTSAMDECVVRPKRDRKHSTYNLFHEDVTTSFKDIACKQGVAVRTTMNYLNGALYDELYGSATPSPEQVRRAELYLQRLGLSLDETNATRGNP